MALSAAGPSPRDDPMSLASEIAEQPAVAARMLGEGRPPIEAIAATIAPLLRDRVVDHVVVAARGSSDHAAIYAQYVFGVRLRLPVALATPSLLSIYGVEPRFDRSLVIGISQSGRSPDIVGVVAAARRQGAPTIALTNDPGSDLAAAAEHAIDLASGPELAVAATKTYTAELLAIALLATALDLGTDADPGLDGVPQALAAALATEPQAEAVAAHLAAGGRDRLIVVGRGYEYATAREVALKLKELARVAADPYSAADFLHGPLALAEPGHPILAIAPSGAAAADVDALLARLGELGVERIVLSDRDDAVALGPVGIRLPGGVPEWLMPIIAIVPGQLLARHLAVARGLDPEAPRWIGKVTLTR
jgi:glutamine---fructose-6-phosphate transaminase (isomerizing)